MIAQFFVDTNVLVYAYDLGETKKRQRSVELLKHLTRTRSGAISAQVLAEFYVGVTRKIAPPLSPIEAEQQIGFWLQAWPVVNITGFIVLEAVRGVRQHQMSFWDAQIWAAAKLNQVPIILSEDFNSGAVVEGTRFVNPFAEAFDLKSWF